MQMGRKEFADPGVNKLARGFVNFQDICVPGFHPAVENNGWGQADMEALDLGNGTVNIGSWFEAGEEGPEKLLQGGGRLLAVIHQQDNRPVSKGWGPGKGFTQVRGAFVGTALNHQCSRQVGLNPLAVWGKFTVKTVGQLPELFFTQAHHHGLGAFVDRRSCVIQGVLGDIGKDKGVTVPVDALQDMCPEAGKGGDINVPVGEEKKLGEGELAFAKNPQAAGKGLTGVAVGHPGRGKAMKTGLAVGF